MRRIVVPLLVWLSTVYVSCAVRADTFGTQLIPPGVANRHGLERAWFTQLRLAPGGRGIIDLQLHISSTKAQTLYRVISEQGPTYWFSDRNPDAFGQPLGVEGAGKAAADKVRLLRLQGIESRIEQEVVPDITLYATTATGMVHAIDAETGRTRWTTAVGSMRYSTTEAAVTETNLVVVNGQTLFVINTEDGAILEQRRVVGGPPAGPALIGNTAFVPLLTGHLKAYTIGPDAPWWPLTYRSLGSVIFQPTACGNRLAWPNAKGDITVITVGRHGIDYRIRLNDKIAGPLIYMPPQQVLSVTQAGDLYSFDISNGSMMWRYACGDTTAQPAARVGDLVFLMTREHGVHAVATATGQRVWPSAYEAARKFVAATAERVYCTTSVGQLVVLDAKTGHSVGRVPMNLTDVAFANNQTDRIYIATRFGALQCLHELGADLPTLHLVEAPAEEAQPETKEEPETEEPQEPGPLDPFAPGGPAKVPSNPFEEGSEEGGESF